MQTLSLRWKTVRQTRSRPHGSEPPLRAELFSIEQLARHAKALAGNHQVVTRQGSNRLLARLDENEDILRNFNRATLAVDPSRRITPAAEWLPDNFYLIEEQIQLARRHLPRGYSRELPRLVNSPSAGLPRVYDIVLELISHVDAQIDAEPLSAFIAAYQTEADERAHASGPCVASPAPASWWLQRAAPRALRQWPGRGRSPACARSRWRREASPPGR